MKIYFHLNLDGFSNCYVITNEITMEAIIIDPGKITKEILQQLEGGPFNLTAVLVTHNHTSHVRGLTTLKKIYTPKVYAADYDIAGSEETILKGDGIIQIAGMHVGYLAVPGHTADSLAYKIGRTLFTGDALTTGIIGSTTSNYARQTLISNLQSKILSQQDDILLMPGHGPPVSIAAERKFNPAFNSVEKKSIL
ncbi:MAG: MBL fold metallo-hydrolase [Spirochaetaceae bacterium]|nr:MBL fold metallo-hydrolase [Spirochaetaceae bacterium]